MAFADRIGEKQNTDEKITDPVVSICGRIFFYSGLRHCINKFKTCDKQLFYIGLALLQYDPGQKQSNTLKK